MKKKIIIGIICFIVVLACWISWYFLIGNKNLSSNHGINASRKSDWDLHVLTSIDDEVVGDSMWCGTFQLVWNDMVNEVVKKDVKFTPQLKIVENLNKQTFTNKQLSPSSYYSKFWLLTLDLKAEIENWIKEKFNETSDILDMFDWNPEPEKYFLYAMLKKDFQYIARFDKLEDAEFKGSEGLVKYFGIDKNSSEALRHTVHVLYYNNPNDFALTLRSKQGDTIYLYRTDDNKSLSGLYADMTAKTELYRGSRRLSKEDEFKAPNIEFKSEREFPELYNKPIKNSGFIISKAVETVQFKMDEAGVELKSEAAMMVEKAMAVNPYSTQPRYFYFNSRYAIFIQEEGKTKPYFAMKIEDAKKLQE